MFKKSSILILLLSFQFIFAQVENVPLNNRVYTFIKEMKVKKIIPYFNEDISNLSRFEVTEILGTIRKSYTKLSPTEKDLLIWFEKEFTEKLTLENTSKLFTPGIGFSNTLSEIGTNKVKYLFSYEDENANVFMEGLGHLYHGQKFKPEVNNSDLYDIGFRFRGTLFSDLGYYFTVEKGGVSGNFEMAEMLEPRIRTSFKWVENSENIGNYEFTSAYLKYHKEVAKGMHLDFQLGRELINVGYGYGSKLVLNGSNPTPDFFQFNFKYGIVHFSSIHVSTSGVFSRKQEERYTKYWAFNRLKLSLPDLFDIGMGEAIVYSGRGIELAYLTPIAFYKFIEMGIQDRDNGNIYIDLQTSFIPNIELQGTFFLDENILSNLAELEKYTNKTAYQIGAFWYEAFTVSDLSLILEYTRIRPYVYTHINTKNTYTAWSENLGHRIGPNSDELFTKLMYNVNDWIRLTLEYRYQRRGENVYDDDGNLVKNVGGDIFLSHKSKPDSETAVFLDGIRFNKDVFEAGVRIEPMRDFIFDIILNYSVENNAAKSNFKDFYYGLIKFTLEY
jgi:hypothetical protein